MSEIIILANERRDGKTDNSVSVKESLAPVLNFAGEAAKIWLSAKQLEARNKQQETRAWLDAMENHERCKSENIRYIQDSNVVKEGIKPFATAEARRLLRRDTAGKTHDNNRSIWDRILEILSWNQIGTGGEEDEIPN